MKKKLFYLKSMNLIFDTTDLYCLISLIFALYYTHYYTLLCMYINVIYLQLNDFLIKGR